MSSQRLLIVAKFRRLYPCVTSIKLCNGTIVTSKNTVTIIQTAAMLDFEKHQSFPNLSTNSHHIWLGSRESHAERVRYVDNRKIYQMSKWRLPPSWIYENRYPFFTNRPILNKFGGKTTNRMRNASITSKISTCTKSQDGGGRHLEFRKKIAVYIIVERSLQKMVGLSKNPFRPTAHPLCRKIAYSTKFTMAAAATFIAKK